MLNKLKEDNLVYFIYQRGSVIYDLTTSDSDMDYFVIVDDDYENNQIVYNPKYPNQLGNLKINNEDFTFIKISEWFKKIETCDIECWECACLPKKFVFKEHVKLLMHTDPLKLRLQIDSLIRDPNLSPDNYCSILKKLKFAIQIIENHKIINFKDGNSECKSIKLMRPDKQAFLALLDPSYNILKKLTDGILEKSKYKRLVKNNA
jgi:hypothetical protein